MGFTVVEGMRKNDRVVYKMEIEEQT